MDPLEAGFLGAAAPEPDDDPEEPDEPDPDEPEPDVEAAALDPLSDELEDPDESDDDDPDESEELLDSVEDDPEPASTLDLPPPAPLVRESVR